MKHLSTDQLLAAVDGDTAHAAHVSSCESCRARVDELREIVALTTQVDVPEPSPLFWDHFSERVREAVAAEPEAQHSRWGRRFGFGLTTSLVGALAIIVIGFAVTMRTGQPMPSRSTEAGMTQTDLAGTGNDLSSLDPLSSQNDDATWALMGDLASQMDWDAATEVALVLNPGSADRALGTLSQEEQQLVVELLQEEIRKSKSL
jgi:hypothetical protein